jgi:uncharacterized protein (TIGR01319 family)
MPTSIVDAGSFLTVDIGTVNTRAAFFDVVDGHYRFIAAGQVATTAAAPARDVGTGVRQAIRELQTVTGRIFLDGEENLLIPSMGEKGVDAFSVTLSAGPAITTAVAGLLGDVSLESVQRLARSFPVNLVETIGLNDRQKPEAHIDNLLRLSPELVIIAGGTDGGAISSVEQLVETVGLACYLMPVEKRPAVLYAGNKQLNESVLKTLEPLVSTLRISPNLRPGIDNENLQPAQWVLNELFARLRVSQMNGLDLLDMWAKNTLMPTAQAEGRLIRFLSRAYDPGKGILGVDLGASSTTVNAAFGGELSSGVYLQLGMGESLARLLDYTTIENLQRWLTFDIQKDELQAFLLQKAHHPASLPASPEDLALEQAAARECLRLAMDASGKDFPRGARRAAHGTRPFFEPIIATGSVITRAPSLGQSLLLLLDGIQPVGITTLVLDQFSLLPALGAAASQNPFLPVQVLESGAFLGLATVISVHANARQGTPVLDVRLVLKNGNESRLQVKRGTIEVLPLPAGQSGRLFLHPHHHADAGFGPGRAPAGGIPVSGTALGIVVDGRGRPVHLPQDRSQRMEVIKRWQQAVGGLVS